MSFSRDSHVEVYPFSRQRDGEEVVIGRVDTNSFLSLPPDAVEVLDDLAAGHTVGEAQDLYRGRHGETPDLEEFLGSLAEAGLVQLQRSRSAAAEGELARTEPARPAVRYHFTNIKQDFARRLFSRPACTAYGLLLGLAALVILVEPEITPGRSALYFEHDKTLKVLILSLISYSSIFIHEMGHLLAARAAGVSSRLGIGHRLWVLVAETDMTGLWSVPRRQRFLPILAGPLTDLLSGSLVLLALFASRQHWLQLPVEVIEVGEALLFVYMMRLLWQFFFFVRTDIYFLIATLFGCKSLMADTKIFLRNLVSRFVRSVPEADQTYLTGTERRVVQWYSGFWLVGRALAFGSLFFVTLPVAAHYLTTSVQAILSGPAEGLYAFIDSLMILVFSLLPLGLGLFLWLRSLVRKWRPTNERKVYV